MGKRLAHFPLDYTQWRNFIVDEDTGDTSHHVHDILIVRLRVMFLRRIIRNKVTLIRRRTVLVRAVLSATQKMNFGRHCLDKVLVHELALFLMRLASFERIADLELIFHLYCASRCIVGKLAVSAKGQFMNYMAKMVVFITLTRQVRHKVVAEECVLLEPTARTQMKVTDNFVHMENASNVAALVVLRLDLVLPAFLDTLLDRFW